jgi:dTDP-glucose 4,6-dehydratase
MSLLPFAGPGSVVERDRDALTARLLPIWRDLDGARFLVTGGTGFFGCWLLEAATAAADAGVLRLRADVLTRDPAGFTAKAPHLAGHRGVRLVQGDVRRIDASLVPAAGVGYTHIVHAATDSQASVQAADPLAIFDTIVEGTRAVLELARRDGARTLIVSSGAAQGPQPVDLVAMSEAYLGGPDPLAPGAAYSEGKRAAEALGGLYARAHGLHVTVARGWAFCGPYLPLNWHFAAGNFAADALAGRAIRVGGDGTPLRGYMYGADLAAWLWTLVARGASERVYNVGGSEPISIAALAGIFGALAGVPVVVEGVPVPGRAPTRYVPCTRRAAEELGLRAEVTLEEGLHRMLRWHGWAGGEAAR